MRWPMALLLLAFLAVRLPAGEARTVIVLGDSLTAGYGVGEAKAYPALLQKRLTDEKLAWKIENAGVSGDTSRGALARLVPLLKHKPAVVVVAIGANDGLRGLPVDRLRANLKEILAKITAAGAKPVVCGMRVPDNLGRSYVDSFSKVFGAVAAEIKAPCLPFLLEGVAADPKLNQADRIHPNEAGHAEIARRVGDFLIPILRQLDAPGDQPAEAGR